METDIERGMQTDARSQDAQDVQTKEQKEMAQQGKVLQTQEKTDIHLSKEINGQNLSANLNQIPDLNQNQDIQKDNNFLKQQESGQKLNEQKGKIRRIDQDELFDFEDSFKIIASISAIEGQESVSKENDKKEVQETIVTSNMQIQNVKAIQKQQSEVSDHQLFQSAEVIEGQKEKQERVINAEITLKDEINNPSLQSNIPDLRRQIQGEENVFQGQKFAIEDQNEPGEKKYQEESKEIQQEQLQD